jgi:hypothetical protein
MDEATSDRPHAAIVRVRNSANGEEKIEHPHVSDIPNEAPPRIAQVHSEQQEEFVQGRHTSRKARNMNERARSPSARLPNGRVASPEANEEWHREKVMQMRMVRDQLRAARKLAAEAEGISGEFFDYIFLCVCFASCG